MSGLRRMLDERLAEEAASVAHSCYSTKSPAATLAVDVSADERWMLPWQHFIYGRHCIGEDHTERVILTFVAQEVRISGFNLGELAEEAANLRLERVRTVPGKYIRGAGAGPFIEHVTVQAVAANAQGERNALAAPDHSTAPVGPVRISSVPIAR